MSSARPRPHQYPTMLLFVVGGVTCNEVRQLKEILASRKTDSQVPMCAESVVTMTINNYFFHSGQCYNWLYKNFDFS